MYFTVYKITNKLNDKIYIGVHRTTNINDNYMGSGTHLMRAQSKYGMENFTKDILHVFDNTDDMFDMESTLVNDNFILREDTYNLTTGGLGGKQANPEIQKRRSLAAVARKRWLLDNDPEWTTAYGEKMSECQKGRIGGFTNLTHSEETKLKMSNSHKGKHVGEKNINYGKMWIYSLTEKRSMRINNDADIPTGWLKGRKIKF